MPLALDRFVRQLDWNLLRTFLVIADERSLTRAGERLFLCQPTISGALRRLEDRLGCRLVVRGAGQFDLTDEGQRVYEHCLQVFNAVSEIGEIKRQSQHEISGRIRLRTISGVSSPVLDAVIADFSRRNPRVQIEISVGHSYDIIAAVTKEMIPIGLCLFQLEAPNVEYRLLCREPFHIYCGAGHPLFGKTIRSPDDLWSASWVEFACEQGQRMLHPLALFKKTRGLGERVVAIAEGCEDLKTLLRGGIGVGFLPQHAAEEDVRNGRLWRLEGHFPPPSVNIYLATNSHMVLSPAEAAFRDALTRELTVPAKAGAAPEPREEAAETVRVPVPA